MSRYFEQQQISLSPKEIKFLHISWYDLIFVLINRWSWFFLFPKRHCRRQLLLLWKLFRRNFLNSKIQKSWKRIKGESLSFVSPFERKSMCKDNRKEHFLDPLLILTKLSTLFTQHFWKSAKGKGNPHETLSICLLFLLSGN